MWDSEHKPADITWRTIISQAATATSFLTLKCCHWVFTPKAMKCHCVIAPLQKSAVSLNHRQPWFRLYGSDPVVPTTTIAAPYVPTMESEQQRARLRCHLKSFIISTWGSRLVAWQGSTLDPWCDEERRSVSLRLPIDVQLHCNLVAPQILVEFSVNAAWGQLLILHTNYFFFCE